MSMRDALMLEAGTLGLAVTVHFVYRWKTDRWTWTHAWGGWSDLEAVRGAPNPKRSSR